MMNVLVECCGVHVHGGSVMMNVLVECCGVHVHGVCVMMNVWLSVVVSMSVE